METKNILIVDDIPANLDVLRDILRKDGFIVRPVTSGKLALAASKVAKPDLILLDIVMPEMDGYEVCAKLKEDPELKDIPVIFLTATADSVDKMKAFSLGCVDYITKPFELGEIKARIKTHLIISDQRRELTIKNDKLQESYAKLQESEKLREDLMYMIVHDIRNFVTTITGHLQLFDMIQGTDYKGRQHIEKAQGSINNIVEMANSLLEITRMEAGELKTDIICCELDRILKETVDNMGSIRNQRDIVIDIPGYHVRVECDAQMTSRILLNLLHNAVKFTEKNGRIITGIKQADNAVRVYVRDDGPGIPPEYHSKIFEKFGRVGTHAGQLSTGLGLTFCKLAVEAQGGEIGLESEVGKGSEFWFTIPNETHCQ